MSARGRSAQTTSRTLNGKRETLRVYVPKAGVSWKVASMEGDGTRELEASTIRGGRWVEMVVTEIFFPNDSGKRVVRKEARVDLDWASAGALRDLLNDYLSTAAAHAEAIAEDAERARYFAGATV